MSRGGTFASLSIPAYRRFLFGNVTSLLGFWLRITAQGWLVWRLTGSEAMLGTVTAVGLLPFVVLSPLGGVWGDRVDRRRLLMLLPLVSVAANVILGVLVATGVVAGWPVLATAVVVGSARAVEIPVRNAFVRDLVGLESLRNAVALNAATFNTARVVGPAIAAAILWGFGIAPCFLFAAAGNLAMTLALATLDVAPPAGRGPRRNPFAEMAEALRYVRGHARTRTLLLLLAIALVFTWSYQTLMPAFASRQLGMD